MNGYGVLCRTRSPAVICRLSEEYILKEADRAIIQTDCCAPSSTEFESIYFFFSYLNVFTGSEALHVYHCRVAFPCNITRLKNGKSYSNIWRQQFFLRLMPYSTVNYPIAIDEAHKRRKQEKVFPYQSNKRE